MHKEKSIAFRKIFLSVLRYHRGRIIGKGILYRAKEG
jgi:hypothetical protein